MGTQYRKLDVQGRVEHGIGRLLEGEDPLILCLTYVLPLGDGLLCGISPFVVVANDAAQQSVVADGNPVMVVERDTGQCSSGFKAWIPSMIRTVSFDSFSFFPFHSRLPVTKLYSGISTRSPCISRKR